MSDSDIHIAKLKKAIQEGNVANAQVISIELFKLYGDQTAFELWLNIRNDNKIAKNIISFYLSKSSYQPPTLWWLIFFDITSGLNDITDSSLLNISNFLSNTKSENLIKYFWVLRPVIYPLITALEQKEEVHLELFRRIQSKFSEIRISDKYLDSSLIEKLQGQNSFNVSNNSDELILPQKEWFSLQIMKIYNEKGALFGKKDARKKFEKCLMAIQEAQYINTVLDKKKHLSFIHIGR